MASPERFDGLEVDRHQARFSGTIDIDPSDVGRMSIDTEFVAVVVFRAGGATLVDNKQGELVRTNKLNVRQFAVVRDADMQADLFEKLPALEGITPVDPPAQLPFGVNPNVAEVRKDLDTETGEVDMPDGDAEFRNEEDAFEVFRPGNSQNEQSSSGAMKTSSLPPDPEKKDYLAAFLAEANG